jgi:hypothetical protein
MRDASVGSTALHKSIRRIRMNDADAAEAADDLPANFLVAPLILVTGGLGSTGSHTARALLDLGTCPT